MKTNQDKASRALRKFYLTMEVNSFPLTQVEQEIFNGLMAGTIKPTDLEQNIAKNKQTPCQIWEEIKGKAKYYKTAYMGKHCVQIVSVLCAGTFSVNHPTMGLIHAGCHELTDYCL